MVRRGLLCLLVILSLSVTPLMAQFAFEIHWDALLKAHTQFGMENGVRLNFVDYRTIAGDARFQKVVEELSAFDLTRLKTPEQQQAFWINVYNIGAIKLVAAHYPVNSIRDLGNLFFPVWHRQAIRVAGKMRTLNTIEHQILRPMGIPDIHFALVCASISCPDLRPEVYLSNKLDYQYSDQIRSFVFNSEKGVRLNTEKKIMRISRIFDWFKTDFGGLEGVKQFIGRHRSMDLTDYQVEYLDYDWSVNDLH